MKKPAGRPSPYTQNNPAIARQPKVRVNDQGLLEGVNPDGSIAWIQDPASTPVAEGIRSHKMNDKRVKFRSDDGREIYVGYSPDLISKRSVIWPYIEQVGLEIARQVAEGDSIKTVCSREGMPPAYMVFKWQIEVPGFKALLAEARKMRAEMYHDEIVEVAENVDEENAKSAKVKLDAYKHLAAVNDPDTFGSRQKLVGDSSAPLSFIFATGIQRNEVKTVGAEYKEVEPVSLEGEENKKVLGVDGGEEP